MRMRTASVLLAAIFLAGAARGADLTAVVSEVEGNVTVKEEAPRQRSAAPNPPIRHARFLQIVRAGDEIRVPTGAEAGLVCSNDRWVSLSEGIESRLTQDLCLKGKSLPPGTYRKLAPVGGRIPSIEGALVLERKTRAPGDEGFGVPTLLSPRNTALLDARPEIVWTPVQEAIEYEIHVEGSSSFRVRLDASETLCNRSGDDWGEDKVCFLPWPDSAPGLTPGGTAFLSVGARHGLASPLRVESEPSRIERLTEERAEEVRASLESLRNLPFACEARRLLEADVYARAGVFSEVIPIYWKALELREAPESRVTLGDVYGVIGLPLQADRSYRQGLAGNPEPVIRAGAEFGLGRIEYDRGSFDRALEHFQTARKLYVELGLAQESAAAEAGMDLAGKRRRGDEDP